MASGLLGTAVSGLRAFQRSLETTSHNIANVNTEGYSRQRVDLATQQAKPEGRGFLGQGVLISNITRSYDQFVVNQLRSSSAAFGSVDKYNQLAVQVENVIADPTIGIGTAITDFFKAVNDATDDPTSIPARQVLLSEAEILSHGFLSINDRFEQIRNQTNNEIVAVADQISGLTTAIADLNVRITSLENALSNSQLPNDLLDERDNLLNKLSKLVEISVVPSKSNMVNVFMGKGQALVLDAIANEIVTQASALDASKLELGIKFPTGNISLVTSQITGGELSGLLSFRDEVLDPAQQRLGSIAASIALDFNKIHVAGFDLDGNGNGVSGSAFFNGIGSVPILASTSNSGGSSLTVNFDVNNISNIDHSDYQLDVTAGPIYTLTRVQDNTSINLTDAGGGVLVAALPDTLPGISISSAGLTAGDRFLIKPTFFAASSISVNLTDPRDIALATNVAIDTAGNPYFLNGANPGDNRNGLALAALTNNLGMMGGTVTFQDSYAQLVSKIGGLTRASQVASFAQETLLNNTLETASNISGVNLDEEAANLIKFQQAYQAAAQMISASNTIFDSLLGAIR